MFSCRDATELMTDEGEGRLSGGRRVKYGIHMFICGDCRAFRRQLGMVIGVVKEIPREEIASEAEARLLEAFRARRR